MHEKTQRTAWERWRHAIAQFPRCDSGNTLRRRGTRHPVQAERQEADKTRYGHDPRPTAHGKKTRKFAVVICAVPGPVRFQASGHGAHNSRQPCVHCLRRLPTMHPQLLMTLSAVCMSEARCARTSTSRTCGTCPSHGGACRRLGWGIRGPYCCMKRQGSPSSLSRHVTQRCAESENWAEATRRLSC